MKIRALISLILTCTVLVAAVTVLAVSGVLGGVVQCISQLFESGVQLDRLDDLLNGDFGDLPSSGDRDPDGSGDPVSPGDATFEQVILSGLSAMEETISVAQLSLTEAELREQMEFFFFTHPEVFYVSTGYQIGTKKGSDFVDCVRLTYLYDRHEIPSMIETYEQRIAQIAQGVPTGASEFDTVLYLHDYIVGNFSYDYRNVSSSERIRDVYRFLDQRTGVCQAYMLLMIALCNEVGIDCLPVTSEEMNHAWNLVLVDGVWYHVDITWDDAGGESAAVYPSYISYDYFLLSGEALRDSGREVAWKALKEATDTRYDEALWRDAATPMLVHDGLYYCSYYDERMGTVICRGTPTEMNVIKILNGARWESATGIYQAAWATLVSYQGKLLFNTATSICTYDLITGIVREVMDLSDTLGDLQIFGICEYTEEGMLTLVVAPDYKGTHELRTVTLTQ